MQTWINPYALWARTDRTSLPPRGEEVEAEGYHRIIFPRFNEEKQVKNFNDLDDVIAVLLGDDAVLAESQRDELKRFLMNDLLPRVNLDLKAHIAELKSVARRLIDQESFYSLEPGADVGEMDCGSGVYYEWAATESRFRVVILDLDPEAAVIADALRATYADATSELANFLRNLAGH